MVVAEPVELIEKGADPSLLVKSISGNQLARPIVMPYQIWPWANVKQLSKGVNYELRVFQDEIFFWDVTMVIMEIIVRIQSGGYHFAMSNT